MGIENFIKDALEQPRDYTAYHIGRELAELHPAKAIITSDTGYFDLEAFVRAEKCALVHETALFNHIKTEWIAPDKDPKRVINNSWLNVLWKGELIDVVLVTFTTGCYPVRHQWIIAGSRKQAEEFLAEVCVWSAEVRGEVLVFHDGEWGKNSELYQAIRSTTFDGLVLRDNLKQEIRDDLSRFFASRELYERHGIPWKRGVLFIGPPGNGKTHTVKALVNQLGKPCLYVKGLKSEYESDQENIRRVFARARITTPCLLVFEDLDSMIDEQSRSFFLNELDGFERNSGIVVLATTNHPDRLDPAILDRPSRFDRKYIFDLPGPAERRAYVELWDARLQAALRISEGIVTNLVNQTEGFSFAHLKELFLSSMMQWMNEGGSSGVVSMDCAVTRQMVELRGQLGSIKS